MPTCRSSRTSCILPVQSGSDRILAADEARLHGARIQGETAPPARGAAAISACPPTSLSGFPARRSAISRPHSSSCAKRISISRSASSTASARERPRPRCRMRSSHEVKQQRLARLQAQLERAGARHQRNDGRQRAARAGRASLARRTRSELAGRTENSRWVNFAGPAAPHRPIRRTWSSSRRCRKPCAAGWRRADARTRVAANSSGRVLNVPSNHGANSISSRPTTRGSRICAARWMRTCVWWNRGSMWRSAGVAKFRVIGAHAASAPRTPCASCSTWRRAKK